MTFTFHPDARIEFIDAIAFYEESRVGLGLRFSREVHTTINRITLGPSAWPQISDNTRRCFTRRFPYGVIYEIRADDILVIAVAHSSREPFYWRDRIK
jgi:plasmid stabilization system protein ParE